MPRKSNPLFHVSGYTSGLLRRIRWLAIARARSGKSRLPILRTELLALRPAFRRIRLVAASLRAHEFVKLAKLVLGQQLTDAVMRVTDLLLEFRLDGLHELPGAFLSFAQNLLDLFPLS